MAPRLCAILAAALCAEVLSELSEGDVGNDVSLLQKRLRFGRLGERPSPMQQLPHPAEVFVDLDVAPEKRWINVSRYYADLGVYPRSLNWHRENLTLAGKALLEVWKIDEEYVRELRGIVDTFRDELDEPEAALDFLKLAHAAYELKGWKEPLGGLVTALPLIFDGAKHGCSGLLAAMPNGTVVHGRNMDYGGFEMEVNGRMLHYPEVTLDVTFLRQGKALVTSTHWPNLIGIHTGIRHGGWSFQTNLRWHGSDSSWLYGMLSKSQGYVLEVRKVLETAGDFETAVARLHGLNLMAPCYFIVAGTEPYQGAIITMDRGGRHAASTPPVMRLGSPSAVLKERDTGSYTGSSTGSSAGSHAGSYTGSWHIIQTNDDQGRDPLDGRRPTEELRLGESTQDMVSVDWVASQLSTPPIHNENTVFTTVYVPGTGYHNTVLHLGSKR